MGDLEPAPSLDRLVEFEDESFTVETEDASLRLTAVDVVENRRPDWRQFTLRFDSDTHIEGDTYRLRHPDLGAFDVALSPSPTADPDPESVVYEATFSRHVPDQEESGESLLGDAPSRRGILGGLLGLAIGGSLLGSLFGSGGTAEARVPTATAQAGGEPFIGQIATFGFDYAPPGWAVCDGATLPIAQHQALFAVLGNQYGGDGRTTFELPDLRGRVPVQQGQGPEGNSYSVGQTGGTTEVVLAESELPAHDHDGGGLTVPVSTDEGDATSPDGNTLAAQPEARGTVPMYSGDPSPAGSMSVSGTTRETGADGGHENRQPFTVVNYCIATAGIFPSRS
jgi:microcystin-dependent protein